MPLTYQKKSRPVTWKYQTIVPLYEGAGGTIIHDIPNKTITFTSATTGEQIVIADRNLGAKYFKDQYGDLLPQDKWYLGRGNIFQWGNCYGSEQTGSVTTSPASQSAVSLPTAGPGNRYSNSTFITGTGNNTWETSNNKNLWGGLETKAINRAGPCSNPDYGFVGFHVPTDSEWLSLKTLWGEIIGGIPQDSSRLPLMRSHWLVSSSPYYRDPSNGELSRYGGGVPWFWTSTRSSPSYYAKYWNMFSSKYGGAVGTHHINYGTVIRPFLSHIYSKNQILALSSVDVMANTMNEYPETYYEKYPELVGYTANKKELDYNTTNNIWTCIIFPIIHKDTQGPCPDYYHIGTKDEWQALITALKTLGAYDVNNIKTYLKIPDAYYLARSKGTKETKYGKVRMWTSTMTSNTVAWVWGIDENNNFVFQEDKPGNGFSIRPFKNNPVAPDNTWTLITTGIYWSSTLGLISIQNGSNWITIMDKNLGATNVGDNGLFYQFGNNTGYTYNASPYVTSKPTLSDNYGPGNYYTGSFVRVSKGNNWFDGTCNNIWGGVTDGDRDS